MKRIPDDVAFLLISYLVGSLFAWGHRNSIITPLDNWLYIGSLIGFFALPLVIIMVFFPRDKKL